MADPTKRTPTLEEYGLSIKTSAMDIRTQAIAMPKEMGVKAATGTFSSLPGHTLDAGVLIKNTSSGAGNFTVDHIGATTDGTNSLTNGYLLSQGEEVFIPTNQASSIRVKATGIGTNQCTYKAY